MPTPLAVSAAEKALHAANDEEEPQANPIHTASAIDQVPSTSSRLQPPTHHPLPPASEIHPSPSPSHPLSALNLNRRGRGNPSNTRVTPAKDKNQTTAPPNVGLSSGTKLLSTRTRLRTLSPDELVTRLDRKSALAKRATPSALSRKLFLEHADADLPYVTPRHLSRHASLSASTTQQAPVDYADVDMVPSQFSGDVQGEQNKAVDDSSPTDLPETQNGLEDDDAEENNLEDQLDDDYCVDDSEDQATSDEPVNGAPDCEPTNPILTQVENTEERKGFLESRNDVEHDKFREEAFNTSAKKEDIIVSPGGEGVSHTDPPKSSSSKSAVDSTPASAKRRVRRPKRNPILDENKSSIQPDIDVGSDNQAAEKNSIPTNHSNSNLPSVEVELDLNDQTKAAQLRSVEEQSRDVTKQVEASEVVQTPNPPRKRRGRPRKSKKLAKNIQQDAGTENSKDLKTTNAKYKQIVSGSSGSRNNATASTDLKQLDKEQMDENGNSSSKAGRSAKKRRMRVSRRELPEKIAGTDQDIDLEAPKDDDIGDSNNDGVNVISADIKRIQTLRKSKRIEYSSDDIVNSNDNAIPKDNVIDNPKTEYKRRTSQSEKQVSKKRAPTSVGKPTVRSHRHRKLVHEDSDLEEITPAQRDLRPPSIPLPNVLNVSADEEIGSKSKRENQIEPSPSAATLSSRKRQLENAPQSAKQISRKRVATTEEKATVRSHRRRNIVREESDLDEFTPGQADLHLPSIPPPNVLNVSADEETGSTSKCEAELVPSPSSAMAPSSRKRASESVRGRHAESSSSLALIPETPAKSEVRPTKLQQRREKKQHESKSRTSPRNNKLTNLGPSSGRITKKTRRRSALSEVLKLQKSLASAAWTDSKAVERQTEVIDLEKEYDSVSPKQTDVLPVRGSQARGSGYGRRLSSSHAASPMPVGGGQTPRKDRVEKATTPKKTKLQSNSNHGVHRNVRSAGRKQAKNKASDAPKLRARPKYTVYESDADDSGVDAD